MKRVIWCVITCLFVISLLPMYCNATAYGEETIIETFEDGSYLTERILSVQTRSSGTVSGSKERNFYNSNGNLCWKVVLNGSFSYTGSSATCTSASCSAEAFGYGWYVISKSASKSGNTASASATMGERAGGITVNQVSSYLTLQCDGSGNLS